MNDELELFFIAAVDAKNALLFRQAIVLADIGDCIETLLPKMSRYDKDQVSLLLAMDEERNIQHECSHRELELHFRTLEHYRISHPKHRLSFMENHGALCDQIQTVLDQKYGAQNAARCFLGDPSALREYRLPHIPTSQR